MENKIIQKKLTDRRGERIGYITITELSSDVYINPKTGQKQLKWDYICDCGNEGSFNTNFYVRKKNATIKPSCGCNKGGARDTLLLFQKGFSTCGSCNETKPIEEFGKNKNTSNGLQSSCKICKSITDKEYRNDPRFRQRILDYKMNDYFKIRNNPEKWSEYLKQYRERRDYALEYNRMRSDPFRKSKDIIRKLINTSLKIRDVKKSSICMKTVEILSCSFEFFKEHIELQFLDGMSWLNHGEWHLDHKVPLDKAETIEELVKLNHWSNFQPLWSYDNLTKSNSMLTEFQELYETLISRDVNMNNINLE